MGVLRGWPGYVTLAVLLGGGAWLAYNPDVPPYAAQPLLLHVQMTGFRAAQVVGQGLEVVTGGRVTEWQVLRWMPELLFHHHVASDDAWVGVTNAEFDGVPVKIFRPRSAAPDSPAIVYIHGGGWTLLSADSYSATTYYLAWATNAVVISIDYRRAPEHPYPIPFEDCVRATTHFLRSAIDHDVNPNRVAIAGDSAGGNLAAAISLKLSEDEALSSLPPLKLQVLIYPSLQALDLNTFSFNAFANSGFLSKRVMTKMLINYGFPEFSGRVDEFMANNHTSLRFRGSEFGAYVQHENLPSEHRVSGFTPQKPGEGDQALVAKVESRLSDPYFSPLMAADVSGVPPAYLIIAQNDPLRDDALLYAQRLREAGVEATLAFHPNMSHGFCLLSPIDMLGFREGKQAFDTLAKHLKQNL